jgi:hypothetical protein
LPLEHVAAQRNRLAADGVAGAKKQGESTPGACRRVGRLRNFQNIIPGHRTAWQVNARGVDGFNRDSTRVKLGIRQIPNTGAQD